MLEPLELADNGLLQRNNRRIAHRVADLDRVLVHRIGVLQSADDTHLHSVLNGQFDGIRALHVVGIVLREVGRGKFTTQLGEVIAAIATAGGYSAGGECR